MESLGRLDAAEAAYTSELKTPATVGCAKAGLAHLGQRAQSCDFAKALEETGEEKAAHEAYLKVLTLEPKSACAKSGFERTQTSTSWSQVGADSESAVKLFAAGILVVLIMVILYLIWLMIQTRVVVLRDLPPAKKIRRQTLQIGNFDDAALAEKLSAPIAGLIRGRVNWRRKDRYGPNLVSGQAGIGDSLDALEDISGEVKGALAIVKFFTAKLPRRGFVLGGEIQPAGVDGPGISLELTVQGGYDSFATFWANPMGLSGFTELAAYQHLAIVAAAWVDHRMVSAMDGENLLTLDPQSWAFFSSGVEWQRQGDYKRARDLYEQALIMDGDNVGAVANLGIIERYKKHFKEAEALLLEALLPTEDIKRPPRLAARSNPDWYRIKYQLAILYANWAAATEEPPDLKLLRENHATEQARSLALATCQTIDDPSASLELVDFLVGTIEPDALAIAASVLPASENATPPDTYPHRGEIVAMLERKTINPWTLIAFVESGSNRSTDTYGNLGCFYAMHGHFKRATERLLTAVHETEQPGQVALVERMKVDPTLASFRSKLPQALLKLEDAASMPLDDAQKREVDQFDFEREVIDWYESQKWIVRWDKTNALTTLAGTHDGAALVVLVKSAAIARSDLDTLIAARARFREGNPDVGEVGIAVIGRADVLPIADPSELEAIMSAIADNKIDVYSADEQGFKRVKGPSE